MTRPQKTRAQAERDSLTTPKPQPCECDNPLPMAEDDGTRCWKCGKHPEPWRLASHMGVAPFPRRSQAPKR